MAGVFRETRIEYDGKEYWFTPSNKFLRRVDAGLAPQTLLGVVATMDGRNVPLPALAYIISEMVKEGGGDVDEDDVLGELYADLTNNNGNGIGPLVQAIGDCITPPDIASKNPTAPASVGAKKPKSQRK
jgi:hypothetical protein